MSCCETDKCCSNTRCCKIITVLAAVLVFAALVWATKKYTTPAPLNANRAAERAKFRAELTAAETDALQSVATIDPAKGTVRLPIADALKLAGQQWQNPAKARADMLARAEKAFAPPPKAPEKPSQYE